MLLAISPGRTILARNNRCKLKSIRDLPVQFQVHYDEDSQSCINVVLEAHYKFLWKGPGLVEQVNVDILMGNISLPRDFKRVEKFGKQGRQLPNQAQTRHLTQIFKVRLIE